MKTHPWKTNFQNELKLKVARKEARRIYERGELHKEWQRTNYRLKNNIPIDAPVMTPHEVCARALSVRWAKKRAFDAAGKQK